ncbi:MAG: DUF5992 family protein [Pseudomonadales bacterium]
MTQIVRSILILVFSCVCMNASAGSRTGVVDEIINSVFGGDNFAVTLQPGWTGQGCGSFTNSNQVITVGFNVPPAIPPAIIPPRERFDRNFVVATSALIAGNTITVYTLDDISCSDGFAIAIEG